MTALVCPFNKGWHRWRGYARTEGYQFCMDCGTDRVHWSVYGPDFTMLNAAEA